MKIQTHLFRLEQYDFDLQGEKKMLETVSESEWKRLNI